MVRHESDRSNPTGRKWMSSPEFLRCRLVSVMAIAVALWLLNDKEHCFQGLEDAVVMSGKMFPLPTVGYGGGLFLSWILSCRKRSMGPCARAASVSRYCLTKELLRILGE